MEFLTLERSLGSSADYRSPTLSYLLDTKNMADPGIYIDTLWVRHCESCSNLLSEVSNPIEKFDIPPVCTVAGMRQALVLALHVKALALNVGVQPQDIEFYCSYLPRAMMTAGLAASMLANISASVVPITPKVSVMCHVGEFPNADEQDYMQRRLRSGEMGCVEAPSESIATNANTHCWIRVLNNAFEGVGLAARLEMGNIDCAPRKESCREDGFSRAWMADWTNRDYRSVESHVVTTWLKDADTSKTRKFHVVLSHGSFIRSALFGKAEAERLLEYEGKMKNTSMVYQRYHADPNQKLGVQAIRADKPIEYSLDKPKYPLNHEQQTQVEDQWNILKRAWGYNDICEWKNPSQLPWSECLQQARVATLEREKARAGGL